jgi:hypothetical protein
MTDGKTVFSSANLFLWTVGVYAFRFRDYAERYWTVGARSEFLSHGLIINYYRPHTHAQRAPTPLWRRKETEGLPILSPSHSERLSRCHPRPGWPRLRRGDFSIGNLIPAFLGSCGSHLGLSSGERHSSSGRQRQ